MTTALETRRQLGAAGPQVSSLALGCMAMSGVYGASDEKESIATIHEAIDSGITLLDTGDFYGMGHNELLLGRALRELGPSAREKVLLSVKFGALRSPQGTFVGYDTRPVAIKTFLAYSLQRLGVDHIDIYRPSRLDPAVPIEDTVGAIADMIDAGYVRYIGLSEMGAETIRRAHAIHPISDLQIEYSVITRGMEKQIFPTVRELGIAVTAYGILSRGLLSGSDTSAKADFRANLPRFKGENLVQNKKLVDAFAALAAEKHVTPVQLAFAWVIAQGDDIVPLMGARKRSQLRESLAAAQIVLSAEDAERIAQAVPADQVAGTRYDERQMAHLDSEK